MRYLTAVAGLTAGIVGVAAPSIAQQSILLRAAPEVGLVSSYLMSTNVSMAMPGAPAGAGGMTTDQQTYTTQTVVGADGDQREYVVVIDSMHTSSPFGASARDMLASIEGTETRLVMDTRGRIQSLQITDSDISPEVRLMMEQMQGGMQGLGWELPENEVRPGDTWDAAQEMSFPVGSTGMNLGMTIMTTYRLDGIETRGRHRVALITFTGTIAMNTAGSPMPFEMEGSVTGDMNFDVSDGRPLMFTSNMDMALKSPMAPAAMNMTMVVGMELLDR